MNPSTSSGVLLTFGQGSAGVIAALERHFRLWDFQRHRGARDQLLRQKPLERREFVALDAGAWAGVYVEHLPEIYELAYMLTKLWPDTPIVASRSYTYGIWECKAYRDRDLLFKIGDDPDHELPWVGRPLDAERVAQVAALLGGEEWRGFLSAVVQRRAMPSDLLAVAGVDPQVTFSAALEASPDKYLAWYR